MEKFLLFMFFLNAILFVFFMVAGFITNPEKMMDVLFNNKQELKERGGSMYLPGNTYLPSAPF